MINQIAKLGLKNLLLFLAVFDNYLELLQIVDNNGKSKKPFLLNL